MKVPFYIIGTVANKFNISCCLLKVHHCPRLKSISTNMIISSPKDRHTKTYPWIKSKRKSQKHSQCTSIKIIKKLTSKIYKSLTENQLSKAKYNHTWLTVTKWVYLITVNTKLQTEDHSLKYHSKLWSQFEHNRSNNWYIWQN